MARFTLRVSGNQKVGSFRTFQKLRMPLTHDFFRHAWRTRCEESLYDAPNVRLTANDDGPHDAATDDDAVVTDDDVARHDDATYKYDAVAALNEMDWPK